MNQFSKLLDKERKRQNYSYFFIIFLIIIIALICTFYFIYSKGVEIVINPKSAAEISSVNIIEGKGLIFKQKIISLSDINILEIEARGYYKKIQKISLKNAQEKVFIELEELPGLLIVNTSISSSDTKWYLNEKFVSESENLKINLEPGVYNLKINNKYYKKKKLSFEIFKGEDTKILIKLEKVEGKIILETKSLEANIYINDLHKGKTPMELSIDGGEHVVRIEHSDYLLISENIIIDNEISLVQRNYILSPKLAEVKLDIFPLGGLLVIDGKNVGNKKSILLNPLDIHAATYTKLGYISETKTFKVELLKDNFIEFKLKEELGEVEIISDPVGQVFLNKALVGDSPVRLKLQSIPQEIKITKDGYEDHIQIVTPSSKISTQVRVKLETILQKRLEDKGDEFKNSIGITMQLFKPNTFTMGARREEKGQRANEFIRKITLRKHFYSSLHEVTNEDFSKFSGVGFRKEDAKLPVTSITWMNAIKFCNWLSSKENLESVYLIKGDNLVDFDLNRDGYRLPTEAEWEWLARKANKKKQTKFVWGNNMKIPKSSGNLADEDAKRTVDIYIPGYYDNFSSLAPVGSFKIEPSGLYDLSGNVSEWMHDFYLLIPPTQDIIYYDPSGPEQGSSHVVKGSSFRSGSLTELRASYRDSESFKRDDLGFRIVRYVYGKEHQNDKK